jgi:hypothetical protein
MSEQSGQYLPLSQNPKDLSNSEVGLLKAECHSLIEAIARKPAAVKLLKGARSALERFVGYKSNRNTRDRLAKPP